MGVDDGYDEDGGFAINGGKGWSKVVFDNHQITLKGNTAVAMGTYYFTDATSGSQTKVEYTFGYERCEDGKPRIFLHHSSVPYIADASGVAPLTKEEVEQCQANWANAIATISKTYADGGDFVGAAADAAGELYGYGHSDVLFKPTKAAKVPFRPTPEDAMSYFVGAKAVDNGYDEDAGFAINGGKGWSKVVFDNHQITLKGNTAVAMGTYYFTDATSGSETKVEYTFGYERCPDGKPRIFLHHSSVPYAAAPAIAASSGVAPLTKEEVEQCQANWANAIATISKTYADGGDFVGAAADAAGELYGYGHTDVLFKPTKAAKVPFR